MSSWSNLDIATYCYNMRIGLLSNHFTRARLPSWLTATSHAPRPLFCRPLSGTSWLSAAGTLFFMIVPVTYTSFDWRNWIRLMLSQYTWVPASNVSAINKLITLLQCGFRKQRSTTDHLIRLESFIREAFIQRQHAVAVFFDLEKAYDCTCKYGIMKDLHLAGLRGRLPCFIEGFLKNSFQSA